MSKKGESTSAHTALYRKYRPRSLDEIVSQDHATNILRRSLQQGRISHAYLLTGPKGVGKTSIARILAHEINQLPYGGDEPHLDIIEIDAASNNGVDDVRELRDRVQLAPISASKKIYIIDEVHMLSKQAFNALLKTLEEPPAHVVFILATTDLHKVPATIISRTQHFAFRAISRQDLAAQLKKIAKGEGLKISDDALDIIAAHGDGSFRNAISLLDQMSSYANDTDGITRETVETALGFTPAETITALLDAVHNGDVPGVIATLNQLENDGIQPAIIVGQLIDALRQSLGDNPQSVNLLDALLAVPASPWPQLKLLTTLVIAAKPKTMATKATMSKPRPTVIEAPVIVVDKTEMEASKQPVTAPTEPAPQKQAKAPASKKPQRAASPFDWQPLLDYTKEHMIALHSVLIKCGYELTDNTLQIYCGRKFNKVKMDEAKYRAQLGDALASIGYPDMTIETLAEAKPPADKKLARIAAIMGGGEEFSLQQPAGDKA